MNSSPDWRDDPPTNKQLNYLQSIFIDVSQIRTKGEASDIIDDPSHGTPVSLVEFRVRRAEEARKTPRTEHLVTAQGWQDRFGEFGDLGTYYKKPIQRQILETVAALDEADPGWDIAGPNWFPKEWRQLLQGEADEKFLSTFGSLFPGLKKKPRRSSPSGRVAVSGKSGCLVLMLLIPMFVAICLLWR